MIRDRSILALLAGEVISRLGSQFTALALPWFVLVGAFVRVAREVHDKEEAVGVWAGLGYLRRDRFVARVSASSLTFGFLFPILAASFPVLAYRQYHRNPRVAGLLFSTIGAGQVVTINNVAGPVAFVIAGPLFVHAGLRAAYALIAGLATFGSVNFIVATRMPGAQEAT